MDSHRKTTTAPAAKKVFAQLRDVENWSLLEIEHIAKDLQRLVDRAQRADLLKAWLGRHHLTVPQAAVQLGLDPIVLQNLHDEQPTPPEAWPPLHRALRNIRKEMAATSGEHTPPACGFRRRA
jgi:hypothetical protein